MILDLIFYNMMVNMSIFLLNIILVVVLDMLKGFF